MAVLPIKRKPGSHIKYNLSLSPVVWIRRAVQAVFLAVMTYLAVIHGLIGGGPQGAPALDAFCPFGGMASLYKYLAAGEFIRRTNLSNMVLLSGMVISVLLFGRAFCAWICPMGTLQEWIGRIGYRLFGRKIFIPDALDKILKTFKYINLLVILFFTWRTGILVFREYDPWIGYVNLWGGIFSNEFNPVSAIIILFITLCVTLFVENAWCRYLCPLGALIALLGRIGLTKVKISTGCKGCNTCITKCPMRAIKRDLTGIKIDKTECIMCNRCSEVCPSGAVSINILGKRITPVLVGILAVVIFMSSYGYAKVTGNWITKGGGGRYSSPDFQFENRGYHLDGAGAGHAGGKGDQLLPGKLRR